MEITQAVSAAEVLCDVRELRAVSLAADAALLQQAACWADLHPGDEPGWGATFHERGRDTGMRLTAAGLPEVSADCVAELAAALGMTTTGGERLIAHALELRHRLPRLWTLIHAGEVPAWQARQVADQTLSLTRAAAGFVDAQVAAVVGRVSPTQLERLITAALIRHMPAEADRRRLAAAEGRCFEVAHDRTGRQHGLSEVWGKLDLPDALALDAAVSDGARQLGELGSTDPLNVRRARAAGDLARHQPALDLPTTPHPSAQTPTAGETSAQRTGEMAAQTVDETGAEGEAPAGRVTRPDPPGTTVAGPVLTGRAVERVVLYLHLSEQALRTGDEDGSGQVENTGCPVTAGQIRDWCGRAGARVTVKPVIDLTAESTVPGYEIPDRIREHVALRDRHCAFPFCSRPAHPYPTQRLKPGDHQSGWRVDTDHIIAHGHGGATSTDNTAPLCRVHHRLKTFAGWRYRVSGTRSYEWTSPHQLRYLRTPDGATHDLGPAPTTRHDPDPDHDVDYRDHRGRGTSPTTSDDGAPPAHQAGDQTSRHGGNPFAPPDSTPASHRRPRRPGALEPPRPPRPLMPFERDTVPLAATAATRGADPPPF